MNTIERIIAAAALCTAATAWAQQAADPPATSAGGPRLSYPEYMGSRGAAKDRYREQRRACGNQSGNEREVCLAQAKAARDAELAQLRLQWRDTPQARVQARRVRAQSAYEVAAQRCAPLAGQARTDCRQRAQTERDQALALIERTGKAGGSATGGGGTSTGFGTATRNAGSTGAGSNSDTSTSSSARDAPSR